MIQTITSFLFLSLACGFISGTIAKSAFFEPLRQFLFFRSTNKVVGFLHELVSCPYYLSHWIAFVMVAVWQPRLTNCGYLVVDLAISAFAMIGVASYAWATYWYISTRE